MPARRKQALPPMSDLLTTAEATEYVRRAARTLHRLHDDGLLGKYYVGSRLYWSITELDALVTVTRPATAEASSKRLATMRGGDAA